MESRLLTFIKDKKELAVITLSMFLIFLNGNCQEGKFNSIFHTGYDTNVYLNDNDSKSAIPISFNSNFDYCYSFEKHCVGGNGFLKINQYSGGDKQNNILYGFSPSYALNDLNKITFKIKYNYYQNGEKTNNSVHEFRKTNVKGFDFETKLKTDSSINFYFSGNKKSYEEEANELDYLDKDIWWLNGKIIFNYYPESSWILDTAYTAVFFNDSPTESMNEEDYKFFKVGIGWDTLISQNVKFEANVWENYFKFKTSDSKFATNLNLNVATKINEKIKFNTEFNYLTTIHRFPDARFRVLKGLNFGLDFIIDPTIYGQTHLVYELFSYSNPNVRNELNFSFDFKLVKAFYKKIETFFKYKFDFVVSDDIGLNIYNETENKAYKVHSILLGVEYNY